jgi:hypothetical protein
MPHWIAEMTGDPLRPIDETWLEVPDEEGDREAAPEVPAKKGRFGRRAKDSETKQAKPRRGLFGRGKKDEAAEPGDDVIPEMDIIEEMDKAEKDFMSELDDLRRK